MTAGIGGCGVSPRAQGPGRFFLVPLELARMSQEAGLSLGLEPGVAWS